MCSSSILADVLMTRIKSFLFLYSVLLVPGELSHHRGICLVLGAGSPAERSARWPSAISWCDLKGVKEIWRVVLHSLSSGSGWGGENTSTLHMSRGKLSFSVSASEAGIIPEPAPKSPISTIDENIGNIKHRFGIAASLPADWGPIMEVFPPEGSEEGVNGAHLVPQRGPLWGVCLVMQDLFGAVDLVTEEQSSTVWLHSSVTVNRWSLASGASLYIRAQGVEREGLHGSSCLDSTSHSLFLRYEGRKKWIFLQGEIWSHLCQIIWKKNWQLKWI